MLPYRPLVVTVELGSPWLDAGDPIHLDGIVMQAQARRQGIDQRIDRSASLDGMRLLPIPLATLTVLGASCAACSAAEAVGPTAPSVVHQVKRRDLGDWDRLKRPVNVAAGPSKDRLVHNPGQVAAGLRWYTWGHRASVMDLLRLLWGHHDRPHGFVGSKRRSGSGEIRRWSVEVGDHPPERCLLDDGRAARHIPQQWVTSAERWRHGAYLPPYWHPERQVPVPWLGVRVELHSEVHAALTDLGCR